MISSPTQSENLNLPSADEVLWDRFRKGDRAAYQTLYRRYLNDLYNYGYHIIPNEAVVTDQIQELFIILWKTKSDLPAAVNVKPYLFRALRNNISKEVGRHKYFVCDMEHKFKEVLTCSSFESSMIAQQTQLENKKRVQQAILILSERQREVINLLFYEQCSYEEVADIMEINIRSVYTLAWKALAALRKELSSLFIGLIGVFL
ncbi:RNA polymerase sigma factor [Tunicatimonas pelagia]|uniref:RNA polymerase sigma factor n=1 Tax=Tunicatimonas pelagia TaxID=931531 RepID=UPI0026653347|nr:sigma-70 family RNA polymerase sigma factor [Tunicatimonas pelagia]WKN44185.1 sigma-70 family RNA polymerase sigma factor [Tunicatimonas pelagia]